jgi:hypothetical protein
LARRDRLGKASTYSGTGTTVEDLTPAEMKQRSKDFQKQMAQKKH